MSRPSSSTFPSAGTKPPIAFNKVDLPAPFVPMRPMTSPGSAWKSTLSTAMMPPKRTDNAWVAITLPSVLQTSDPGVATRASDGGGAVEVLTTCSGRRFSSQLRSIPRSGSGV